jgi:hypothetical protein
MNEIMVFPISFMSEPCPISPQWIACRPMAISTGVSSSRTSGVPPVMNSSVPFSAPSRDPVMGASRASAPFSRRAAATRRASPGEIVEVST